MLEQVVCSCRPFSFFLVWWDWSQTGHPGVALYVQAVHAGVGTQCMLKVVVQEGTSACDILVLYDCFKVMLGVCNRV